MSNSRTQGSSHQNNIVLAYTFLRIIIGINYFNHGFTRIGNIPGFMDAMVESMQGAWMPEALVRFSAALVSPVELIAGLLITIGLFTRGALVVCLALMVMLMYGVTIVQNWDAAGSQLVYDLILVILLAGLSFNRFSVDHLIWGKRNKAETSERPLEGAMRFMQRNWIRRRRTKSSPHL